MPNDFVRRLKLSLKLRANRLICGLSARALLRGLDVLEGERFAPGEQVIRHYLVRRRSELVNVLAEDPEFRHRQFNFGQEGEDLILARLLADQEPGFYVDVGAHHPFRFSNTYLLHKAGWRGINIDATPGLMNEFRMHRPGDINLELMIGEGTEERTLYLFNEPALNTASREVAASRDASTAAYRKIGTAKVRTVPLRDVLAQHLPQQATIGVLSVDVEGEEMSVLRSNDWIRFRPNYVLVEQLSTDLSACLVHETTALLQSVGYSSIAKAYNTAIFRKSD